MSSQNVKIGNIGRAIDMAVARGLTFFAVAEPSDVSLKMWIEDSEGDVEMTMAPFDSDCHRAVTIKGRAVTEVDAGDVTTRLHEPMELSTDRECYLNGVGRVIDRLRSGACGDKTVISRVVNVTTTDSVAIVVGRYFSRFPDTFRYVWSHPDTGLWMGATPELLLDFRGCDSYKSMSVAGTRQASTRGEWDDKNRMEHDAVTGFICDRLSVYCDEVVTGADVDVRFGEISHLCTPIEGRGVKPGVTPDEVLRSLSPTPAVCGFPREAARVMIRQIEMHDRLYYGGYLKFGGRAWVNLRCARVSRCEDTYLYTIYSGGGITASSVAEDEWEEACAKSRPLMEAAAGEEIPAAGIETIKSAILN